MVKGSQIGDDEELAEQDYIPDGTDLLHRGS
jgi:hypothetical protein